MQHKSKQIVIILIVVLLLAGVGVGLYFLIEHIRKQHDKNVKPKAIRTVGADDKCDSACSSNPTFAGKTIVHQVNCQNPDGTKCDEKNCPKKPTLDKCTCHKPKPPPPPQPKCEWKPGEWIPQ